jgi:Type IV leader peptidase family.
MIYSLSIIVLSVILGMCGFYLLNKLTVYDSEVLFTFRWKDGILLTGLLIVTGILLLNKNHSYRSNLLFYSLFLFWYLYLAAWIDFYTMKIYRIFNLLFCTISCVFFLIQKPFTEQVIAIVIYIGFIQCLTAKQAFGKGDSGIFITVALFLGSFLKPEYTLIILMVHHMATILVFLIFNRKQIDFRKFKMKRAIPLAPSIAIATWVITVAFF